MEQNKLCLEELIVLLCSRSELTDEQYEFLKTMLMEKPDWGKVFKIAVFNKTMGLVSKHILHFNTDVMPGLIRRQLLFMNRGNYERNKSMFDELANVLRLLNEAGISYSPLKGAYMIPYVYKDFSVRLSNDIDILIKREDSEKACEVMKKSGFIMGKYNDSTNTIIPAKRIDDVYWKAQMGNIHPFTKICDNPFLAFLVVDFAFDVDPIHKNTKIAEDMLDTLEEAEILGTKTKLINPVDFFIHVCTHLYKEACAKHAAAETYSDINLIKFCDVRELFLANWKNADESQISALVERAKLHKVENALIYSFECCEAIYGDDFWSELAEKFKKMAKENAEPMTAADDTFWNGLFRR